MVNTYIRPLRGVPLTLLYFIVRDHALLDGTKRGAELIFQEYLSRNGLVPLQPQVVGRLLNEIEAGRGRAHQEHIVATIIEELRAATAACSPAIKPAESSPD
jgi:hypothetical protein